MGFLNRKKSIEEQEAELEAYRLEGEVLEAKSQVEERKAVIRQLKAQYGRNWAKTLGVSSLTDLSTLKGFLRGAKTGMSKAAAPGGNSRDFYWPGGPLAGSKKLDPLPRHMEKKSEVEE